MSCKRKIIIVQPYQSHDETIGAFLQSLKCIDAEQSLSLEISVLAENTYGIFTLYEMWNLDVTFYYRENVDHFRRASAAISQGYFDLVIFNSPDPAWIRDRYSLKPASDRGTKVVVLHHCIHGPEFDHEYIKMGTSKLLKGVVDHVFLPYYDALPYDCESVTDESASINFVGTHHACLLKNRDLSRVREIEALRDDLKMLLGYHLRFNWYLNGYSSYLDQLLGSNVLRIGMDHLSIYKQSARVMSWWGTYYKPGTRYYTEAISGTVPFAVNAGFPVMGDADFLNFYEFDECYISTVSSLTKDVSKLFDVKKDDYYDIRTYLKDYRDNIVRRNAELLKNYLV